MDELQAGIEPVFAILSGFTAFLHHSNNGVHTTSPVYSQQYATRRPIPDAQYPAPATSALLDVRCNALSWTADPLLTTTAQAAVSMLRPLSL